MKITEIVLCLCVFSAAFCGEHRTGKGYIRLNRLLHDGWNKAKLKKVSPADDCTFLRRARIDLTGRAPSVREIQSFCADKSPGKRAGLVRSLLNSEEFADLMAMRYADLFRVKSEFPINLWPNAVQLYYRYLRESALHDVPLTRTAREMLTSSGSNFRVAPANFFRASADRTPEGWAKMCAVTWLGLRLEKMPPEVTKGMAPFFSRIAMKSTGEWKEQIVYTDPVPVKLKAAAPDGKQFVMDTGKTDPRRVFAEWLVSDPSRQFSKVWVNRAWYWIFGKTLSGIQPDDMPVPAGWKGSSPETLPELNGKILELLAEEFHKSGGKMRSLMETICLSDAYLADWKTVPAEQLKAESCFAVYPVHRHDAEVILDLLGDLTGSREQYRSVIPEPFTFLPPSTRAVQVADGSISTGTLDTFGRPPRDSGFASERNNSVTGSQRLYLMNSASLFRKLERLCDRQIIRQNRNLPKSVDACYLSVLSRPPSNEERRIIRDYAAALPAKERLRTAVLDLLWSLVNSKEFLFHH